MGRRTREPVFRVRFRSEEGNKSVLVNRKAKSNFGGGKVLRINKVSDQERLKVGEFFPADRLMKELRDEARKANLQQAA